jgi:hypothetical protein
MVGPRVHADLMASHVFLDQHRWTFNDAGADDEEGCQDIFRGKIVEEFPEQLMLSHHAKKCPAQKKKLTELYRNGIRNQIKYAKTWDHSLQGLGPSSKLTPQSNFFGHAVISVSRVVLLHVHQPRALASPAAAGSPTHDPSAVGDHEGISKPLSSCIHV